MKDYIGNDHLKLSQTEQRQTSKLRVIGAVLPDTDSRDQSTVPPHAVRFFHAQYLYRDAIPPLLLSSIYRAQKINTYDKSTVSEVICLLLEFRLNSMLSDSSRQRINTAERGEFLILDRVLHTIM